MVGLFRYVVALPAALAMRSQDLEMDVLGLSEQAGTQAMLSFSGNPGSICGGAGIWQLLTQGVTGETFTDARNLQWGTIESMKNAHLEEKKAKVALLEERLAKLKEELEAALQAESLPSTGAAEHTQMITAAVGPGGYGDMETAKSIKCGMVRKLNGKRISREVRGAFEASRPIFAAAAKDFFAQKTHRLDGMGFLATCKELLVIEPEEHHYCAQLCQEYKDLAQSASSSSSGDVAVVSNKIKNEIEEVQQELAAAKSAIAQCDVDWSSLDDFKGFILGMKKTYEDRHEIFRKAEAGLRDVEDDEVDLEDQAEELQEQLEAAQGELDASKEGEKEAKGALEEAKEKLIAAQEEIGKTSKDFTTAHGSVTRGEGAMKLLDRLKEKVTAVMMLMMQFADAGLREPLANLGFSEDPEDLNTEFVPAENTEDAPVLEEALGALKEYCTSTAQPAFNLVKQKLGDLDLSPLCNFKDTPGIYQELLVQVDKRMASIKEDLLVVVSWLNPWRVHKDKSMKEAEAMEDALVAGGQLACLEQVKGIYTEPPNDWFKYLIGWRKDGPHHKLIADLGKAIEELKAKAEEFEAQLKEAQAKAEAAKAAIAEAEAALAKAIAKKEASQEDVASLEAALAALREQQAKTAKAIDDWTDKVNEARKNLDAARTALVSAYTEFTAA